MKEKNGSPAEVVLLCAIAAVACVYAYFFVFLPQYWTLRDDYMFAVNWGGHRSQIWHLTRQYLKSNMSNGRFQPMDALNRALHYRFLPLSARVFRITFFMSAALGLWGFVVFLRAYLRDRAQILLAVLLVLSNLAFKEWLTALTVSEAIASIYFIWALAFFSGDRARWLALLLFPLACASKESFVVLAAAFPVIEYFRRRPQWPLLAGLALEVLAFGLLIHHLPRIYTASLSVSKLHLGEILKSFVLPPLKSFGPALALLIFAAIRGVGSKPLFWTGVCIVAVFTIFINAWGPFDSWFYLHTFIPFGWAMIFAAVVGAPVFSSRIGMAILACTAAYLLTSAVNGSKNYYDYFLQSRQVADLACHAWEKDPKLQVVTNCYEGSTQLTKYIQLENRCPSGFHIEYFVPDADGGNIKNILRSQGRREFLYSKYCDDWTHFGFDLEKEIHQRGALSFSAWTFVEKD